MMSLLKKPSVFLWLALMLCAVFQSARAQASSIDVLAKPMSLDEFELMDHESNLFTLSQLKDQWSLVFLGFTSCPDICPLTMSKLEGVRAELGLKFSPTKIPNIIFVAVDPERDKPVLGEYLKYFHPKNIGLTGETSQIDLLVKGVDGFYRLDKEKKTHGGYEVVHTSAVAVINPQGQMVAKINPPFDVNDVAWDLTMLIRKDLRRD